MAENSPELLNAVYKEISEKLTRLPLRYFDSHQKGDILSRITNDIEKVADTLEENILWLLRGCSLYNKVAWNKNSQRLCRQDTQKSKRPQEESSPTFGSKYFL